MNHEIEEKQSKPKISISVRWDVVFHKRNGLTSEEVSQILPVSASSATRIYNNWLNTGEVADTPRSGRPKVTSEKDEKMLIECAKDNPDMCVEQLLDKANLDISKTTGWRVLIANDYQYRTAETKWYISLEDRKERLRWAKEYIEMSEDFWQRIVFTDECKVQYNSNKI